ncbi:MAG: hypothetical protein F6J87_15755 [Spirulina sp. SIO3F2]|nr:hypothetical protein [Spirulina sp. SIO3F2]
MAVIDEVIQQLQTMNLELQQQVLRFARSLATTEVSGTPASELLPLFGCIPEDDIQIMKEAVDFDCGQIDYDGW